MKDIKKVELKQSSLNKLTNGLLFLDFEQTVNEPEYDAVGMMTNKHFIIQKRYQYSQDLERALKEANLTAKLLSLVENGLVVDDKSFEPEDLISYYDGIYLDYIHQIKDKVLRLFWWLLQDQNVKHRLREPDKIKLSSFTVYKNEVQKIGVAKLLEEWNQTTENGIAVALRKRTQHHHFTSKLQLNSDYQKIKMSRNMLAPVSLGMLSEYGKKRMKEIGQESYEKWRMDITDKHLLTLELVTSNLNTLASKFINYYHIPTKPETFADVMNKYAEVQKKFDIQNRTSISNIPANLKGIIDEFVTFNKQFFGEFFVSMYIVGSVPRGEYIPGSSDINIIVITTLDKLEDLPDHKDELFNVEFFTEKYFQSEKAKKYRFICWSDGVLLAGKEFKFNKKEFPKPGTLLALLLNRGFIGKLEAIKETISKLEKPNHSVLRQYTLEIVKIIMDFGFGVAMANKPFYTSSRLEKIQYIKEMFPTDQRRTLTIEMGYKEGLIAHKDFPIIIDDFIANETKNYQKMLDVEKTAKSKDYE